MSEPDPLSHPSTLLRRRSQIPKALPPLELVLRGSLLHRKIRCGKPNCHCAKDKGHPLLVLSVTFPGGKTRQVTVPAELREVVESWIENYRLWWKAIEEVSEINRRLLQLREIPSTPLRRARPKPAKDCKA